jgi:hypothetical protein
VAAIHIFVFAEAEAIVRRTSYKVTSYKENIQVIRNNNSSSDYSTHILKNYKNSNAIPVTGLGGL